MHQRVEACRAAWEVWAAWEAWIINSKKKYLPKAPRKRGFWYTTASTMSDDSTKTTIATYDKTAKEYILKVQKYAPMPERKKFMSLIKPGGKILDAGCGLGRDANYFASQGFAVTGIDLSNTLLDYAKKTADTHATFYCMDLRNIRLNVSFDGIWACASLLHLTREAFVPALARFYELLTPGGIVFLLMKEGQGEKLVTSGTIDGDTRFFTYYTSDEIRESLESLGFEVTNQYVWDQKERNKERPSEVWISTFGKKPLV